MPVYMALEITRQKTTLSACTNQGKQSLLPVQALAKGRFAEVKVRNAKVYGAGSHLVKAHYVCWHCKSETRHCCLFRHWPEEGSPKSRSETPAYIAPKVILLTYTSFRFRHRPEQGSHACFDYESRTDACYLFRHRPEEGSLKSRNAGVHGT